MIYNVENRLISGVHVTLITNFTKIKTKLFLFIFQDVFYLYHPCLFCNLNAKFYILCEEHIIFRVFSTTTDH